MIKQSWVVPSALNSIEGINTDNQLPYLHLHGFQKSADVESPSVTIKHSNYLKKKKCSLSTKGYVFHSKIFNSIKK